MNKVFFNLLTILILSTGNVIAQINLSPHSSATAQTFGTFSRGLDAVSWNPSILAYEYRTQKKKDIRVATEVDIAYHIHTLTIEPEEQSNSIYVGHNITTLFTNDIKELLYEDSIYVNLQSLQEDRTFNVLIDKITNHATADFYLSLMNDEAYSNTLIDTMFHSAEIDTILQSSEQIYQAEKYKLEKEKSSFLELMNMGVMLSNSSLNVNQINTYILNGGAIGTLGEKHKNELLSDFPDDGLGFKPLINYKAGLRIKNIALHSSFDIYSEFVIPSGLFDLAFWGNKISEPIDFHGRKNQFQAVTSVAISYGRQINMSPKGHNGNCEGDDECIDLVDLLNNFTQRSYFGISAKYLTGLAYFESAFNTLSITPDSNYTVQADIITKYSLAGASMEVDPEKPFNYSFNTDEANKIPTGSGYAFDLGLIMDINDKLSSSIAITNLLGKITWSDGTTYKHRLKMNSQISMDELQENPDSSLYSGIEIDTNIAISSFQTNYPGALILGAEYTQKKIKLATNLKFGFSNELGSSTVPRFSLGVELRPLKWLSLLGGTSVGGYEGFQWGSGISMRLLFLQFSCAYSEYGGMLNSAKGFSLSLSNSIVF